MAANPAPQGFSCAPWVFLAAIAEDSPYSIHARRRLEWSPMLPLRLKRNVFGIFRAVPLFLGIGSVAAFAGTASGTHPVAANSSPKPEPVAARDAWRQAESFTAGAADRDVVVGSGGSMLPLYPDRTVLLIRRLPMAELCAGMTVVFIGDRGRPVAHVLVQKTWLGWVAQGLANSEADRTRVADRNYLGTVVRAFTPLVGTASSEAPLAMVTAAAGQ